MQIGRSLSHHVKLALLSLGFLLCLPTFIMAAQLVGDTKPKLQGKALPQALKPGGYVLYFRHGATNKVGEKNVAREDLDNCVIQRNLSPEGVTQTKAMGAALKRHQVPVGDVYTSPYCRCVDTAMNLFGKGEKSDALHFAIHVTESQRQESTQELLKLLAPPPPAGMNTAIVSHTANLMAAVNIFPRPEGVAHVFKLGENGQFSYVGMMLPDAWLEHQPVVATSPAKEEEKRGWFGSLSKWVRDRF